jgi:site-specific recombinase XerD
VLFQSINFERQLLSSTLPLVNTNVFTEPIWNATRRFADWGASKEIHELAQVESFHVAAFAHDLQEELSPPSVKQHLAAIRMLFDWLVTGHVIETNPAHSVRGPRYTVKKGKTPVLTVEEAHALLESIPITKKPANDTEATSQHDLLGLRDRALIAIMVYSFARIGAVIQMKVGVPRHVLSAVEMIETT